MQPEKVMGVLPNLSDGFFGQRSYSLVITNYRFIFAEVNNQLIKEEQKKAVAGTEDKGLISKWKATVSSGFRFHERYYNMNPQAILQESPNNYEIRPEQIKTVKIMEGSYNIDSNYKYPNTMVIKWTGKKKKFKFEGVDSKKAKEMMAPLLGSKLR